MRLLVLILSTCLISGAMGSAAASQTPVQTRHRMIVTAGVEIRVDDQTTLDQSLTGTVGLHAELLSPLSISGSLSYSPDRSGDDSRVVTFAAADVGFRLQDTRGPWMPYVGVFFDLHNYSYNIDGAPQTHLVPGLGLRAGLCYNFGARLGGELFIHGVRQSARPETLLPDYFAKNREVMDHYYDYYGAEDIYNPVCVGIALSFRL